MALNPAPDHFGSAIAARDCTEWKSVGIEDYKMLAVKVDLNQFCPCAAPAPCCSFYRWDLVTIGWDELTRCSPLLAFSIYS